MYSTGTSFAWISCYKFVTFHLQHSRIVGALDDQRRFGDVARRGTDGEMRRCRSASVAGSPISSYSASFCASHHGGMLCKCAHPVRHAEDIDADVEIRPVRMPRAAATM